MCTEVQWRAFLPWFLRILEANRREIQIGEVGEMTKQIALFLVGTLIFTLSASAEEPVVFPDEGLKAAVEDELRISDPTPTDMLSLTRLICINRFDKRHLGISDLEGLQYATNMMKLVLRLQQISGISILSELINLRHLDLSQNLYISDISPLSTLDNLAHLDMHSNSISDLNGLSGLNNLGTLILRGNAVTDISPISGLKSLQWLDISGNINLRDISDLSGLTTLEILALWNADIYDISALSNLQDLKEVKLGVNHIRDISPLLNHKKLTKLLLLMNPLDSDAYNTIIPQIIVNNPMISIEYDPQPKHDISVESTVGGTVDEPGEGVFESIKGEVIRLAAIAEPGFIFDGWTGAVTSFDNPCYFSVSQDSTIRARFLSLSKTLYVDANNGDANFMETDTGDYTFHRIQDAIDVASSETTILVNPGIYHENIDFLGKNIQLLGANFRTSDASWPIISGRDPKPAVHINTVNPGTCSLSGFVIAGCRGYSKGAITCTYGSPTITNCIITGNRSDSLTGAAIYCRSSDATFINCTIADNQNGANSAGIYMTMSNTTFDSSIIWNNQPSEIMIEENSSAIFEYSNISGSFPGQGNINMDPLFAQHGYWFDPNDPNQLPLEDDPNAIWMAGDYHLQSETGCWHIESQSWVKDFESSPCIDQGNPNEPVSQESFPHGDLINMGAYGGTSQASHSMAVTD